MEILVHKLLSEYNIDFFTEYSFDDCVGVNGWRLRFDFYIPEKEIAIECDGEQHYHPVEFFGGKEKFETLKQNDFIKDTYCEEHGITLIRLSYEQSNSDIQKTIQKILA